MTEGKSVESSDAEKSSNSLEECRPLSLSGRVDEKGYCIEEDRDAILDKIKQRPGNRQCFDCYTRNPSWMSTSFGILLCMMCSGKHRNLGSSISFVRSCDLDNIRPEELLKVELRGNAQARHVLKSMGWTESKEMDYRSKMAEKYRTALDAEAKSILAKYRPELVRTVPVSPPPAVEHITSDIGASTGPKSVGAASAPMKKGSGPLSSILINLKRVPLDETSCHTASSCAPAVKPRTVSTQTAGFEFDFEQEFAECSSSSSSVVNHGLPNGHITQPPPVAIRPAQMPDCFPPGKSLAVPDTNSSKFSGAKSISSDDYFASDLQESNFDKSRLSQFSNEKSISSAAYFNESQQDETFLSLDEETSAKIAYYSEQARQKVNELGTNASEAVRRAALWLGQVSRS